MVESQDALDGAVTRTRDALSLSHLQVTSLYAIGQTRRHVKLSVRLPDIPRSQGSHDVLPGTTRFVNVIWSPTLYEAQVTSND